MKPEVQSHYDSYKAMTRPEILVLQRKRGPEGAQHKACAILLDEIDEGDRRRDAAGAERRHLESFRESQASRRFDKWALSDAIVALLVGGARLWWSFPQSEPARVLPASASSVQAGRYDPIAGSTFEPSTEPTPQKE